MDITTPPKRLTRQGWLEFSLQVLGKNGPKILRLEAICEAAGKTRGSFYHHFEDHESFLMAVLEYWQDINTQQIIRLSEKSGKPYNRLKTLNQLTAAVDKNIENAIRQLAANHKDVAGFVQKVDLLRLDYLESLNKAYLGVTQKEARHIAELEYGLFIGLQTLFPDKDADWFRAHGEHLDACLSVYYSKIK